MPQPLAIVRLLVQQFVVKTSQKRPLAHIGAYIRMQKPMLMYMQKSKQLSTFKTDRHVSFITIGKKAGFLSRG